MTRMRFAVLVLAVLMGAAAAAGLWVWKRFGGPEPPSLIAPLPTERGPRPELGPVPEQPRSWCAKRGYGPLRAPSDVFEDLARFIVEASPPEKPSALRLDRLLERYIPDFKPAAGGPIPGLELPSPGLMRFGYYFTAERLGGLIETEAKRLACFETGGLAHTDAELFALENRRVRAALEAAASLVESIAACGKSDAPRPANAAPPSPDCLLAKRFLDAAVFGHAQEGPVRDAAHEIALDLAKRLRSKASVAKAG